MKFFLIIFIFIFISACGSNNYVYWCGDHECVNNKERESYFKKTMSVEIRDKKKNKDLNKLEIAKIKQELKSEKNRNVIEKNN